jgi:hypothetical protein
MYSSVSTDHEVGSSIMQKEPTREHHSRDGPSNRTTHRQEEPVNPTPWP